jgi:hypothetical protein
MSRFHYLCPSCSARLASKRRARPGRSLRCPRCTTRFPAPPDGVDRRAPPTALAFAPPPASRATVALVLAGLVLVFLLAVGLVIWCYTPGEKARGIARHGGRWARRHVLAPPPAAKVDAPPAPVTPRSNPLDTAPPADPGKGTAPRRLNQSGTATEPAVVPAVEKERPRPLAAPPPPGPLGTREDKERWQDLQALADKVAQDFGRVGRVSVGRGTPLVVFEEAHNSRAEQIEIARMLLRLYRQGVRHLAVEGYVQGTFADVAWFHKDPKTLPERRRIAAQLLEDGEIGCAEFLALVLPEVTLHPIERAAEHAVELPEHPEVGLQAYLDAIMQQSPDDPWITAKTTALQDRGAVPATEDSLALMRGLEKRAVEVGATVDAAARAGLQQLIRFLEARSKASDTMVAATLGVVKDFPQAPIAMHIGAGHTKRVSRLLADAGQPYVVLTPKTLTKSGLPGDVSRAAMRRRDRKLSVDDDGKPGSLLDGRQRTKAAGPPGRKRPEPALAEPWFRAKVDLYSLCAQAAQAAEGLGTPRPPREPPFGIPATDSGRPLAALVPATVQRLGGELVFAADVLPQPGTSKQRLWVRTIHIPRSPQEAKALDGSTLESLEGLLDRALRRVRSRQSIAELATEELRKAGTPRTVVLREGVPQTVQVDCDTLAVVGATRQGVVQPIATRR